MTLTEGLAAAIPGIGLDDRFAHFRGSIQALAKTSIELADISFPGDPALPPTTNSALTGGRATAANGRIAAFDGTANAFLFAGTTPPPPGAFEVEARLRVVKYSESGISLTNPTADDIAARYGFLPNGTSITLAVGTNTATFTKTADVFATTETPDAVNHTFTSATFNLPANASSGVVVRCAESPRVGEYVRFGTNNLRITAVKTPGGSVYVLTFAETTNISTVTGASFALKAFNQRTDSATALHPRPERRGVPD